MSKRRKIASPDLADDPIMRKKSAKDKSNEKIMKWSSDDISKTTFAQHRNFAQITQKSDIDNRPMWVCPNGIVYLDTGSPLYKRASDFLVAIADPLCRPKFMHEYKITSYSLYAAASLGLTTEDIITSLSAFSKIELHDDLKKFIQENTEKCGKVKLLLKKTRYFVESPHVHILHELLDDPVINDARIDDKEKKKTDKDGGRGSEKEVPTLGVSGSLAALEKNKKHRYHHLWEKKIKALKAKANDLEEERDEETGFLLVSGQPTTVYIPGTGATTTDKDGMYA